MKLTYGPDRDGGVRDMFLDEEIIAEGVLSYDAIVIVEALTPKISQLETRIELLESTLRKLRDLNYAGLTDDLINRALAAKTE